MKQTLLTLMVLITFSTITFAQNNKVTSAIFDHKYGDLDKAKTNIDLAAKHPKTISSAKTWFYHGLIYSDLYSDSTHNSLCDNCLLTAATSFSKASEYDSKKEYLGKIQLQREILKARLYEKGATLFGEGADLQKEKVAEAAQVKYLEALSIFEMLINDTIYKLYKDPNVIYNATLSADRATEYEKAVKYYELLFTLDTLGELEKEKPLFYRSVADLHLRELKDTTAALDVLNRGREIFPENKEIIIDELNVYLATGQQEVAIKKLEKATELDAKNPTLFFALGATYDGLKDYKNAKTAYLKALELKPDYFDVNYNLGALLFNEGAEMVKKANAIPYEQVKKYKAAEVEFKAKFAEAKPYLEKAFELRDDDYNTLLSLQQIYSRLGETQKSKDMKALRTALEAKEKQGGK